MGEAGMGAVEARPRVDALSAIAVSGPGRDRDDA
jgi:hypothetical protein